MTIFHIIIVICLIFQIERGFFDTVALFRLLRRLKKADNKPLVISDKLPKKRLYILLPVFFEQRVIEKTIYDFLQVDQLLFDVQIIVITTIREGNEAGAASTEEVVRASLRSGVLASFGNQVHIIREKDTSGNMATQLNYALQKIAHQRDYSDYYLIYNADSIVSSKTPDALLRMVMKNVSSNFAFQQPCAYVRSMKPSASGFINALSLYQTWYCLGHESRLLQKYEAMISGRVKGNRLGVITGHGSGMSIKTYLENGGYPEDLMTEDLTFGFILSANKVPILLLPALEVADVPAIFSSFIKQRSVWFWNYLGYVECYQEAKAGHGSNQRLLLLLYQGVGRGLYWLFSSIFVVLPIIVGLLMDSYLTVAIIAVVTILSCIMPQYILFRKLPDMLDGQDLRLIADKVKKVSFVKILFPLVIILITDSIGPWIAVMCYLKYLYTGNLPTKYKTED